MRSVRFPEMRSEVMRALQALADPDYQRRVWVNRVYPHPGFYDDFTLNIHILYDDTRVLEAPHEVVGSVLSSDLEAEAMARLAHVINSLFERVGTDLSDEDYLRQPEWSSVVEQAQAALATLSEA
jgi:hypothetical protein